MTTNVQEMFGSLLLDKKIVASLTARTVSDPGANYSFSTRG